MIVAIGLGIALATAMALPLAAKWQLGPRRVALGLVAFGVAAGLLVLLLGRLLPLVAWQGALLTWALTLGLATALLAYRFYRDPERRAPARDDLIVSPADGEVVYVYRSLGGELPVATKHGRAYTLQELTHTPLRDEDAIVVGIAMNFLDVHVNRAPITGEVTLRQHFPGRFGSLRQTEMVFANERATTVIAGPALSVAVVQIASRLVRQIVSYVPAGATVAQGQRIGAIRFGSQVDLVMPAQAGLTILVAPGDRVTAGESLIGRLEPVPAATAPTPEPTPAGQARASSWQS